MRHDTEVRRNTELFLMKGGKLAAAYEPHLQSRLLGITFVTVGELYFGRDLTGLMIGQTFILSAVEDCIPKRGHCLC